MEVFQQWFADDLVDFNEDDAAFTDGRSAISWAVHNSYPPYSEVFDDLIIVPLPDFGQGARTGQGSWQWGDPHRGAGRRRLVGLHRLPDAG